MSGHSKWAQIKHRKEATDAKKGKIFSKLSRAITIAAKSPPAGGGSDPKTNHKLSGTIEEARKANMPSDNIERAIAKASAKDGAELKEALYEVYGPGGSAIIISAVTAPQCGPLIRPAKNLMRSSLQHFRETTLKNLKPCSPLWMIKKTFRMFILMPKRHRPYAICLKPKIYRPHCTYGKKCVQKRGVLF